MTHHFEKKCKCCVESTTEQEIRDGLGKCEDCGCRYWTRVLLKAEREAVRLPWE